MLCYTSFTSKCGSHCVYTGEEEGTDFGDPEYIFRKFAVFSIYFQLSQAVAFMNRRDVYAAHNINDMVHNWFAITI